MNRREFVSGSVLALAAAHAGRAAEEKGGLPIVDTHQHLWDLTKLKLPWLKMEPKIARSYLPEDYRKATAGLNVVKAVYMEVAVDPSQLADEAEYVIGLCKNGEKPTVAAVISGRPADEGFEPYMRRFRDGKYVKGIRQVLHEPATPPGYCLDKKYVKGIRLLGELGLSFDLCMRFAELNDAAKLIDACPDTRFILDHCGNAEVQVKDQTPWKRGMDAVAKRKNVVCKVSGIVASAKPGAWSADDLAPFVNYTLDAFGPERVMFGGDWPVCTLAATYKQWVDALKQIVHERKVEEQRKLFHDNAVRFYGLA